MSEKAEFLKQTIITFDWERKDPDVIIYLLNGLIRTLINDSKTDEEIKEICECMMLCTKFSWGHKLPSGDLIVAKY